MEDDIQVYLESGVCSHGSGSVPSPEQVSVYRTIVRGPGREVGTERLVCGSPSRSTEDTSGREEWTTGRETVVTFTGTFITDAIETLSTTHLHP